MKIYVALAAYNEEKNIGALLEALTATAQEAALDLRVVIVNDGSKDRTEEVIRKYSAGLSVNLINQPNAGFLAALTRAIEAAVKEARDDDVIVTMDADNTHPAEIVPILVRGIGRGYDVVIASRFAPGGKMIGVPFIRLVYSEGAKWLLRCLIGIRGVKDYSTSYRAYRAGLLRKALAAYPGKLLEGKGFSGMAAFLIRLSHLTDRIAEVPLVLRYDRKRGASALSVSRTLAGYGELVGRHLKGGYRPAVIDSESKE